MNYKLILDLLQQIFALYEKGAKGYVLPTHPPPPPNPFEKNNCQFQHSILSQIYLFSIHIVS